MKRLFMVACLLMLIVGVAGAGVIQDIRTGVIPEGSYVMVTGAVVTAVMGNSYVVSETEAGPNRAVWVYEGETPAVAEGDVVDIFGTYIMHNGRATISLLHPAEASVVVTGTAERPDNQVTVLELLNDPEGWASARVFVSDGLIVQELMENGQWIVASYESGHFMVLDDYFLLFPDVQIAECYNNAEGVFFFYGGEYVLKTLSVEYVDCTVGNEDVSFGAIKQIYR